MKTIKEKVRRSMKYMRVTFQQSSGRDRLNLAMFAVMMLVYTWWAVVVL